MVDDARGRVGGRHEPRRSPGAARDPAGRGAGPAGRRAVAAGRQLPRPVPPGGGAGAGSGARRHHRGGAELLLGPRSCSRSCPRPRAREELWLVESGIGARIGLPKFGISGSFGHKSVAGVKYETADSAALKSSLKQLDTLGQISFGSSKGWSMSSTWDEPMYFAYRVQSFQPPSCASYMNDLPEVDGKVLFTGVSSGARPSRSRARTPASRSCDTSARSCGSRGTAWSPRQRRWSRGSRTRSSASIPCRRPPEGPAYLARVRMYVDRATIEAAAAETKSLK